MVAASGPTAGRRVKSFSTRRRRRSRRGVNVDLGIQRTLILSVYICPSRHITPSPLSRCFRPVTFVFLFRRYTRHKVTS